MIENPTTSVPQGAALPFPGTAFDVVALAASAGGLSALSDVLSGLPADFPAALVIVQHLDPKHRSLFAHILGRRTPLSVQEARAGDILRPGAVFIAPPDHHLLVNPEGTLSLSHSALVHFVRPSADLLFESTAGAFRERAIAVVLTGMGRDGSLGLAAVKQMGGKVIAQDEGSSEFFGMPHAAILSGRVDLVLPLSAIAPTLIKLVRNEQVP